MRSKRRSRNTGVVGGTAFVLREQTQKISCSGSSQTLPARPSGKGGWMQGRRQSAGKLSVAGIQPGAGGGGSIMTQFL